MAWQLPQTGGIGAAVVAALAWAEAAPSPALFTAVTM